MNNKLIYILSVIVIIYAIYYCYSIKKMEYFLTESFTTTPTLNISTNGRCGPSYGNTICPPNQCCSKWSWCGGGNDYCINGQPVFDGITSNTVTTSAPTPAPTTTPAPTQSVEDLISDGDAEDMLKQLELLQGNLSKTTKIIANDFSGPNNFVPYVVNNMTKLNKLETKNQKKANKEYQKTVDNLNEKIKNFRYQLEMENGRDIKTIKSITSVESGQPITVMPINHKSHVVVVNNKCLSADSVGSFDLNTCNYMDAKQHFNLNPIYHDTDYNINLAPSMKKVNNTVDETGLNVKYPFVMVKSESSGNCLGNVDGQVFLKPCQANSQYRWTPSTSLYQCKSKENAEKV